LLWITANFGSELLQGQAVDLPEPGQFFQDFVRTWDRIVTEKFYDSGNVAKVDGPIVFPIPDAGGFLDEFSR
jgi:hypothetical protein